MTRIETQSDAGETLRGLAALGLILDDDTTRSAALPVLSGHPVCGPANPSPCRILPRNRDVLSWGPVRRACLPRGERDPGEASP